MLNNFFKKFTSIFIGVLSFIIGMYMVLTKNYNDVSIVIISVVALVGSFYAEK